MYLFPNKPLIIIIIIIINDTTNTSHRYALRNRSNATRVPPSIVTPNSDSYEDPISEETTEPESANITRNNPNKRNLINRTMTYIGAAENFKMRYRNHLKSFRNQKYEKETELSKYIATLNENKIQYSIKWKIVRKTSGYNQVTKSCNLCTAEKFEICKFRDKNSLLNKRNELISKCRHENKYLIANLPDD